MLMKAAEAEIVILYDSICIKTNSKEISKFKSFIKTIIGRIVQNLGNLGIL